MISNTNGKRKEKSDNQVDTTTNQDGLNDDLTPDYMNILGKWSLFTFTALNSLLFVHLNFS